MTTITQEIGSALKKSKIFIAHSIYQYIPHIDYHPMDVAALAYYATCLDITIPPKVEQKTEQFLLKEIRKNYAKMPMREIFWGLSYLLVKGHTLSELSGPIEHIFSFQNESGGVGFYQGDVSRIPGTGWLLSTILSEDHKGEKIYETHKEKILKAANFLVDEWTKDVSIGHALSYKGAYVLTSLLRCQGVGLEPKNLKDTVNQTVDILLDMQIENGSWTFLLKQSDKRISFSLSAPHITSRVMLSLCEAYQRDNDSSGMVDEAALDRTITAIENGSIYLCETQNELGFWYAHDAGELAVINGQCSLGLKEALEVLPP
ncbi:MAG: hypothetical protein HXS40_00510 [Theionarchaea archaeon]|nr:hypothetical protein [Theionarchaea archaeon]